MRTDGRLEDLLRQLAPQVLGALVRRYGHFEACEDAVQEALLAAAVQWPERGSAGEPAGWLITVASRRLTDQLRSDRPAGAARTSTAGAGAARRDVAPRPTTETRRAGRHADAAVPVLPSRRCPRPPRSRSRCAPSAGLTTAEIARAFLVPEATMAQRISRAKQRIKADGTPFAAAARAGADRAAAGRPPRAVPDLQRGLHGVARARPATQRAHGRGDPADARASTRLLPDDGEVAGLLALMLLTDARRAGAHRPDGALVPLAEQDRGRWNRRRHRTRASRSSPTPCPGAGRPVPAPGGDRRRPRRGRHRPRTPTGRRSSPSTACSSASHPTRWSRSTTPSRSRWSTARRPGSTCSRALDADEPAWPATTVSTPSARTCWRWPATRTAPGPATGARPARTTSLPEQRYLEARAARLAEVS